MGGVLGIAVATRSQVTGSLAFVLFLGGIITGFCIVYFGSLYVTFGTARTMGNIYHPQGRTTPPIREYSRARTLTKQGNYERAAAAWELNVAEYPEDTVPYMELGRLYRNQFNDYGQSVSWYSRAAQNSNISVGHLVLVTQEIAEIYQHKLHTPEKAIPFLAELVRRYPDDPNVDAARKQLAELRKGIENG